MMKFRHGPALLLATATLGLALTGCGTPPVPSEPGASPASRATDAITLSEPSKWQLRLTLSFDDDDKPRPGNFEFRGLRCGGTYSFGSYGNNGEIVLNQKMLYGSCVKDCAIVLGPNLDSYRETCRGRVTGSGVLQGAERPMAVTPAAGSSRTRAWTARERAAELVALATAPAFQRQAPEAASRFSAIAARLDACEADKPLTLYSATDQQLWLGCSHRFRGQSIPLLTHIGPHALAGPSVIAGDAVRAATQAMKSHSLSSCGMQRSCANVAALGYIDAVADHSDGKVRIAYRDASAGLAELDALYAKLNSAADPLEVDPSLWKLADPVRVADVIKATDSLEQLALVRRRLEGTAILEEVAVRTALSERTLRLETQAARRLDTFAGFQNAYRLSREEADFDAMKSRASGQQERSAVFAILMDRYRASRQEDLLPLADRFAAAPGDKAQLAEIREARERERQAEEERRKEAKLAEERRAAEQRLAEQRAAQARAEEERCLKDARCRAAVEERRAACAQRLTDCRRQCDRATGSGTFNSFISNLAAAAMARACYAGCKCDSGFGDIVAKFNGETANSPSTRSTSAGAAPSGPSQARAATANTSTAASTSATAAKSFQCKIYCVSASGPTVTRTFQAASRQDAARQAEAQAAQACTAEGHARASTARFNESQCVQR